MRHLVQSAQEERMGLVKTRRLASMYKKQRAIHLRQGYGGLKAGMKPPMKGDIRRITNRATIVAMREAERIAENHFVPKYSTRESFVRSLEA